MSNPTTAPKFAGASLLMMAALAGCATPPAGEAVPPRATPAPTIQAPAPRMTPPPESPAKPTLTSSTTPLDILESILKRMVGNSDIKITRTPTGALLLRATGDAAFSSGSAALSPHFSSFLQQLANGLITYPALSAKVSGHTDSVGDASLNEKLSESRAHATVNRLVSLGVPATRLLSEGKGEREPIASNDTAEGREANRRVDVLIIDSGP